MKYFLVIGSLLMASSCSNNYSGGRNLEVETKQYSLANKSAAKVERLEEAALLGDWIETDSYGTEYVFRPDGKGEIHTGGRTLKLSWRVVGEDELELKTFTDDPVPESDTRYICKPDFEPDGRPKSLKFDRNPPYCFSIELIRK